MNSRAVEIKSGVGECKSSAAGNVVITGSVVITGRNELRSGRRGVE